MDAGAPLSLAEIYERLARVRQDIVLAGRILSANGLARGFGHISVRVPDQPLFLVTPALGLDALVADLIELADLDGAIGMPRTTVGGPAEINLHAAVYRSRPDVGALVRVQPEFVEAFGAAGLPIRPLNNMGAALLGATRIHGDVGSIDRPERGAAAARALGDGVALVLRGNGCLVAGPDVRTATLRAVWLEDSARLQFRALALASFGMGPAPALSFLGRDEIDEIGERLNRPERIERAWSALARQVGPPEGPAPAAAVSGRRRRAR